MYKALNYWVFGGFDGQRTPYEFIDWAAEQELDGVELTVGDCLPFDISREECRKIAGHAAVRKIGLRTLASGSGWNHSLGTDDEQERRKTLELVEQYMQIAAWIGAETILVVPGATRVAWEPDQKILSYRTVWENVTRSVRELIPLAEKLGVNLALENVWNRFLISPMEWKCFLEQFHSERVGIYFDTGNAALNCRPRDFPEILGSAIKAVHLKNFIETDCGGGLHNFGDDLLEGCVDFPAFFAEMEKINYQGTYTAEMIPFSRLPDMVLPDRELAEKTARQLKRLAGSAAQA